MTNFVKNGGEYKNGTLFCKRSVIQTPETFNSVRDTTTATPITWDGNYIYSVGSDWIIRQYDKSFNVLKTFSIPDAPHFNLNQTRIVANQGFVFLIASAPSFNNDYYIDFNQVTPTSQVVANIPSTSRSRIYFSNGKLISGGSSFLNVVDFPSVDFLNNNWTQYPVDLEYVLNIGAAYKIADYIYFDAYSTIDINPVALKLNLITSQVTNIGRFNTNSGATTSRIYWSGRLYQYDNSKNELYSITTSGILQTFNTSSFDNCMFFIRNNEVWYYLSGITSYIGKVSDLFTSGLGIEVDTTDILYQSSNTSWNDFEYLNLTTFSGSSGYLWQSVGGTSSGLEYQQPLKQFIKVGGSYKEF